MKPFSINLVLTPGAGGYSRAKVVAIVLNAFMASADQTIGPQHVPYDYAVSKGRRNIIEPDEKRVDAHTAFSLPVNTSVTKR